MVDEIKLFEKRLEDPETFQSEKAYLIHYSHFLGIQMKMFVSFKKEEWLKIKGVGSTLAWLDGQENKRIIIANEYQKSTNNGYHKLGEAFGAMTKLYGDIRVYPYTTFYGSMMMVRHTWWKYLPKDDSHNAKIYAIEFYKRILKPFIRVYSIVKKLTTMEEIMDLREDFNLENAEIMVIVGEIENANQVEGYGKDLNKIAYLIDILANLLGFHTNDQAYGQFVEMYSSILANMSSQNNSYTTDSEQKDVNDMANKFGDKTVRSLEYISNTNTPPLDVKLNDFTKVKMKETERTDMTANEYNRTAVLGDAIFTKNDCLEVARLLNGDMDDYMDTRYITYLVPEREIGYLLTHKDEFKLFKYMNPTYGTFTILQTNDQKYLLFHELEDNLDILSGISFPEKEDKSRDMIQIEIPSDLDYKLV